MAALPSLLSTRAGWVSLLEAQRTPEPHVHQIEPTNRCPFSCRMCTRATRMDRPLGDMPWEVYQRLVGEIAGFAPEVRAKEIELFHFGESLLHPRLPDMVALALANGLRPVLSVNPPLLTPALAEAIVGAGPVRLICSLDADDAATYRDLRGAAADFPRALAGINAALAANARLGRGAEVVVRMIRMHANRAQEEAFRRRWQDSGATVEVREFFPWNDPAMAELGSWQRLPAHMPCPFPWRYLVVQWNGDVVPCCRDAAAEQVMGNVGCASLRDIWNGEAYRAFRARMAAGELAGTMCGPCAGLYEQSPAQSRP